MSCPGPVGGMWGEDGRVCPVQVLSEKGKGRERRRGVHPVQVLLREEGYPTQITLPLLS